MSGSHAGAFDRVIEFIKMLPGVDDLGCPIPGGVASSPVQMRAKRPAQVSKEIDAGGENTAIADVEWIVRWRKDIKITADDLIRYEGESYQIIAPPQELGRRDALRLLTRIYRPGATV